MSKKIILFSLALTSVFVIFGYTATKLNIDNTFSVVKIGNQEWMSENLNAIVYRNGEKISYSPSEFTWKNLNDNKVGCWCFYNNDSKNGKKYGILYNWYALNDPRGIAPEGWHVASKNDWATLINYLGGNKVAGEKLRTNTGWYIDESDTTKLGNGSDEFNFKGLPTGFTKDGARFSGLTTTTYWWTSTEFDDKKAAHGVTLHGGAKYIDFCGPVKRFGFAVRCVKNK